MKCKSKQDDSLLASYSLFFFNSYRMAFTGFYTYNSHIENYVYTIL